MAYRQRINELHEKYSDLEKQIIALRKVEPRDNDLIFNLLRQQNEHMREIQRLTRLQWDIDHDTVEIDEDR